MPAVTGRTELEVVVRLSLSSAIWRVVKLNLFNLAILAVVEAPTYNGGQVRREVQRLASKGGELLRFIVLSNRQREWYESHRRLRFSQTGEYRVDAQETIGSGWQRWSTD